RVSAATALTEPFEPGSTLKPFIAAALLAQGRAKPDDSIAVFGGEYTINGRTLRDVHRGESMMTLAEVLQWSSNVGIARFAERLTPREQYEALRDFGFGTPTGVPFPSEASGRLRIPAEWSKQSPASLAIGYEISVTPMQLAVAYAAFANGGRLLEPALVKEIRAADGTVVFRHTPRVARQVIPPSVASQLRSMLVAVVNQGSAVQADVETYLLAGKTGTARRNVGGRYAATQYYATFVGLFPAEDPQFVILVKLDSPQGEYYGGATAAPVTRAVLEAALAARDAALDRRVLAALPRRERPDTTRDSVSSVTGDAPPSAVALAGEERVPLPAPVVRSRSAATNVPFVATLPYHPPRPAARPPRTVPVVAGLELRDAVRALHEAGFKVRLAGNGPRGTTQPAAGTLVPAGAVIRLYHALE
ncbi:MAG TPA: penicillin-binding transpeptidase domain-containing protein, partial [Gemmatimonadaceae bacterium]|nr:penicillin-binding transpeptidase domain-containing protein [Gemmatimonadaceae bacterium]